MSKIPSELWPQEFFKNVIKTNEIVKLQIKLLSCQICTISQPWLPLLSWFEYGILCTNQKLKERNDNSARNFKTFVVSYCCKKRLMMLKIIRRKLSSEP